MRRWHTMDRDEVLEKLKATADGLSEKEATARLQDCGPNAIPGPPITSAWAVFFRQFADVLIAILFVAAVVSAATGELTDAGVILAIVVLNAVLGFVQEHRAEKALHALREMMTPTARVVRDGAQRKIDAADIVPGDVILLEAGEKAPADAYILEATNCEADEAALTGESLPVGKDPCVLSDAAALAERRNVLFSGTTVTNGTAKGVVFGTGLKTEFGRIAELTREVERGISPLKAKMARLGKQLGVITIVVCALIVAIGFVQRRPFGDMFMTGVSLAVAVLPEGLPAVVTITLALGLRRMLERNCLIRRLTANEALGSVSVICTDKTGTLTKNEMTVTRLWLPGDTQIEVKGTGYEPEGDFFDGGRKVDAASDQRLRALLETGLLCNHAELQRDESTGRWRVLGNPTEGALVVAALKGGIGDLRKERGDDRESEFSFSSSRKRMTVVYRDDGKRVAHVKGAPEMLLERSARLLSDGRETPLSDQERGAIAAQVERMAGSGLRVLALARRELPGNATAADEVERDLTFIGLVGIVDPPRPEVKDAVALARKAGIEVVVLTGDNALTAHAVAGQIGISVEHTYLGADIDSMSSEELSDVLRRPFALFARVSPEHKLRVIEALKRLDKVIAMTGDGVNDAPALKRADVGIAMGIKGTEVAREASDVVLLDDNFASIVRGTEEGRRQYDNIQKFARFLLSCNFGEIVAIAAGLIARLPLIMLPVQILWMNIITDGLPALALGVEETEPDAMERPPRHPRAPILSKRVILALVLIGLYEGLATYFLFRWADPAGDEAHARTVAFTGLIVFEMINVFNFRSLRFPMWRVGYFTNRYVLAAVAGSLLIQAGVVYLPFMRHFLRTAPLSLEEWGIMVLLGAPLFIVVEAIKAVASRRAAQTR